MISEDVKPATITIVGENAVKNGKVTTRNILLLVQSEDSDFKFAVRNTVTIDYGIGFGGKQIEDSYTIIPISNIVNFVSGGQ